MNLTLTDARASDLKVVNGARVSLAKRKDAMEPEDDALIAFLMRNGHSSPFRHGYFEFLVECSIGIQRNWMRHTAGHNYNEMSTRYVEMPEIIYEPEFLRSQEGKPGAYTFTDFDPTVASVDEKIRHRIDVWRLERSQRRAFKTYRGLLKRGWAREQAKFALPLGTGTQFIWSCNPLALMNFIEMRGSHGEAIKEMQLLTDRAEMALVEHMPITYIEFLANGRKAP